MCLGNVTGINGVAASQSAKNDELSLSGKRLMVIGGLNNAEEICEFARSNDVTLYVAGRPIGRTMKAIASKVIDVDVMDEPALLSAVKQEEIDGIFVAGNEDVISKMIDFTKRANLPFYATRETWDKTSNKRVFKTTCAKHGLETTGDYDLSDMLHCNVNSELYPVVLKPIDNCGSKGVVKCDSSDKLKSSYAYAKEHSRSGGVTIEKYVDGDEFVVYYTFADGRVSLTSMADKYCYTTPESFLPLSEVYAYPSRYLGQYMTDVDGKMRSALLDMGIENGMTSIQGFYRDGHFYFFEMGYRLGGTAQHRYTRQLNDITNLDMMLKFALSGKMVGYDGAKENPFFSKPCCTLTLMSSGGVVGRIEGLEEIQALKEVIYVEKRYDVGDFIPVSRSTTQFHFRFFIVADSVSDMKELLETIQTTVKAYDNNGNSMLVTHFDVSRLDFGSTFDHSSACGNDLTYKARHS